MPRIGLVGIVLALCAFLAFCTPRVEASKVTMEAPAAAKNVQPEADKASDDVTAVRPHEVDVQPVARPSGHKPVQYDALPEHHRKPRSLQDLLGQVAEV